MPRTAVRGCLVAALILLAAGPAAAATAHVRIDHAESVEFAGRSESLLDAGSLVAVEEAARGTRTFAVDFGRISVWTWNATAASIDHPAGTVAFSNRMDPAIAKTFRLTDTTLDLALDGELLGIRVVPGRGGNLRVHGDVAAAGAPVLLPSAVSSGSGADLSPMRAPDEVDWRWEAGWTIQGLHDVAVWPGGWPAVARPRVEATGPTTIQLFGGNLSFRASDGTAHAVRLGAWTTGQDANSPAGSFRTETVQWAIFEGSLSPTSLPLARGWAAGAPQGVWSVDGTTTWRNATGTVVVDGLERRFVARDVEARGVLDVAAVPTLSQAFGYEASGEVSTVLVGGVADARLAARSGPTPVGVTLAAAALAALGLGGWALYTRTRDRGPLGHPMRRAIYEQVVAEPGLHKRELQRRTACGGWGTFQFHFKALERAGIVQTRREGRYLFVFSAAAAADASPTIPNALARRIYRAVPEEASISLADLRAAVGVSYQLVKYHVGRLQARGLVRPAEGAARSPVVARVAPPRRDEGT